MTPFLFYQDPYACPPPATKIVFTMSVNWLQQIGNLTFLNLLFTRSPINLEIIDVRPIWLR